MKVEWSVTVGGTTVTDPDPDQLIELLQFYSPALAIGRRHVSATMTVPADSARAALDGALELMRGALVHMKVGELDVDELEVVTMEELLRRVQTPNLPDLVGVTEVAEILGVSKQRVWELSKDNDSFPPAALELKAGPVWLRTSVDAWKETWPRRTGRPPKKPLVDQLREKTAALIEHNDTLATEIRGKTAKAMADQARAQMRKPHRSAGVRS